MKGFLQVASLFGIPLAIVIWYDLLTNPGGYLNVYTFKASRWIAIGIYFVLALLCFHTPLHIWRRFNSLNVKKFCLTLALAIFWVAVRLTSSGKVEPAPVLQSAAVFLIPVIAYFVLSHFLVKWARPEFDRGEEAVLATSKEDDHGNS